MNEIELFKLKVSEYKQSQDKNVRGMENYVSGLINSDNLIDFCSVFLAERKSVFNVMFFVALRSFLWRRLSTTPPEIKEKLLEMLTVQISNFPEDCFDCIKCLSDFIVHDIGYIDQIIDFLSKIEPISLLYDFLIQISTASHNLGCGTIDYVQNCILERSLSILPGFSETPEYFFNLFTSCISISPNLKPFVGIFQTVYDASSDAEVVNFVIPVIESVLSIQNYDKEDPEILEIFAICIHSSFVIVNTLVESDDIESALILMKNVFDHEGSNLFAEEFFDDLSFAIEFINFCVGNDYEKLTYFMDLIATITNCYLRPVEIEEGSVPYNFSVLIMECISIACSFDDAPKAIYGINEVASCIGNGVNAAISETASFDGVYYVASRCLNVEKEIIDALAKKIVEEKTPSSNVIIFIREKSRFYPEYIESFLSILLESPDELKNSAIYAFNSLMKTVPNVINYVDGSIIEWIESILSQINFSESLNSLLCLLTILNFKEEFSEAIAGHIVEYITASVNETIQENSLDRIDEFCETLDCVFNGISQVKEDISNRMKEELVKNIYGFIVEYSTAENKIVQEVIMRILNIILYNGLDPSLVNDVVFNGLSTCPNQWHIIVFSFHLELLPNEVISSFANELDIEQNPVFAYRFLEMLHLIITRDVIPNENKLETVFSIFPIEKICQCLVYSESKLSEPVSAQAVIVAKKIILLDNETFDVFLPCFMSIVSESVFESTFINTTILLVDIALNMKEEANKNKLISSIVECFQGNEEIAQSISELLNAEEINQSDLIDELRRVISWRKDL